ncbi:MAG: MATE family efflux transporter [Bacteroidetes bacterium GWF2_42_66]|nr:MAG: MATE family efflux transporter [Bacteroidetes bacterium GWA2_42_15]OFY02455.1 MAG: MATE family efflux transporter [Bacteroidetes bacterium GWE2_42_39]OFY41446.1 MAG: MATE family efflux transporter [Bacteroidetes bacterium GWF2_42_66]HBL75344.1 MATE family efflux transporter [Prolixibacteraceae bacterium]HCR91509.1 MATE family efflux transporter [Prolixibacteraceae bacterium]
MNRAKELESANISRLMLKFFIPAFIGVFVNALYNIVDRIFIGQGVGSLALSGISVIFPVMLIMMAFGMLIGIGAGVLVSINMGRKDMEKAEKVLGNSFVLMILVSIVITLVGFAIKGPMLRSFGATPETIGYANDYLNIILVGVVFQVVGFSLNSVIRSEGNAKIAMYSMLISAGTNIVLDPIFIFWFGWGVKGAAYATVISMMVLTVWVLLHFKSSRSVVKIRSKYFRIDKKIVLEILAIGMAPFVMQIANSFVQGLLNKTLISFGSDIAVGAMGIINSVLTLVVMSVVAINMASQPIIGFNFGANKSGRVKEALRIAIISASVISVAAFALIQLIPDSIIKLFESKDEQLLEMGRNGLRIAVLALPVVGFQVVAGNFFQSVGKAKIATLLTLLRQVVCLIPLLLIFPFFFGLKGVWMAIPVADSISAIIVTFFLLREWKRLDVIQK